MVSKVTKIPENEKIEKKRVRELEREKSKLEHRDPFTQGINKEMWDISHNDVNALTVT